MTDFDPNRATTDADSGAAGTTSKDAGAKTTKNPDGSFTEEFKVSGEAVVSKIKELLREGNVRRISIKNDEGRTLIEIPLTLGVIGTLLLPVWAGIGAIAALAANLTIAVERPYPKPDASVAVGGDMSGNAASNTASNTASNAQGGAATSAARPEEGKADSHGG